MHRSRLSRTKKAGFTLIELLVVLSIISLISSITFASLTQARLKAKDAAVREEVSQMRTLFEFEYNDNNSYVNLQKSRWVTNTVSSCSAGTYGFAGAYANQAQNICTSIVNANNNQTTTLFFWTGVNTSIDPTGANKYSIMAYLPYKATWFCIGSSGTSDTDTGAWTAAGCYNNP